MREVIWERDDEGGVLVQVVTASRVPPTIILTDDEAIRLRDWLNEVYP